MSRVMRSMFKEPVPSTKPKGAHSVAFASFWLVLFWGFPCHTGAVVAAAETSGVTISNWRTMSLC